MPATCSRAGRRRARGGRSARGHLPHQRQRRRRVGTGSGCTSPWSSSPRRLEAQLLGRDLDLGLADAARHRVPCWVASVDLPEGRRGEGHEQPRPASGPGGPAGHLPSDWSCRKQRFSPWPERHRRTMESMNDPEAAARVIIDILATGNLDAVSSAVAEDYTTTRAWGMSRFAGGAGSAGLWRPSTRPRTASDRGHRRHRGQGGAAAALARNHPRRTNGHPRDARPARFADGCLIEHWGAELSRRER